MRTEALNVLGSPLVIALRGGAPTLERFWTLESFEKKYDSTDLETTTIAPI